MNHPDTGNRFQAFFKADLYLRLKNYLYNYLLRKKAIAGVMPDSSPGRVLEIGTGISPVCEPEAGTVFTEVAAEGLLALKKNMGAGTYVVADATALPFKSGTISCCVSSEVIEHIDQDLLALREMARVLAPGGRCLITFPHRTVYYSVDDTYVNHYRRYNLADIRHKLKAAGLSPGYTVKVLGPLEKIIMISVVLIIKATGGRRSGPILPYRLPLAAGLSVPLFKWINRILAMLVWLDAKITPPSMSSVLLIVAERDGNRSS